MTDWVVDLDGVMWRGRVPITGSAEAVGELLARGDRVVFCSNNSAESGEARAARLGDQGVPEGCEVVTSADAVCALVEPGERVLVLGGPGLCAALEAHGARPTPTTAVDPGPLVRRAGQPAGEAGDRPFDAVVVGLTREFGYRDLDAAAAAVRCGGRLLASNADTTFPGADGLHPGCGSLVAAVEAASGRTASVAGKPHGPMVELLRSRLGMAPAAGAAATPAAGAAVTPAAGAAATPVAGAAVTPAQPEVVVVGDRGDTDGRLAQALGVPFLLVLSGVTARADLPLDVPVARVGEDLAELVLPDPAGGPPR